jgi:hypothetical protein
MRRRLFLLMFPGLLALMLMTANGPAHAATPAMHPMLPPYQIVQRNANIILPSGAQGSVVAKCQAGEQLVGGGYTIEGGALFPDDNFPLSSVTAWSVRVDNTTAAVVRVTAFADCLQAPFSAGEIIVNGTTVNVAPPATAVSATNCPAGATVTGGGWSMNISAPTGRVFFSVPASSFTAWGVAIIAVTGPLNVRSIALCSTLNLTGATVVNKVFPVGPGATVATTATCPAGTHVSLGGFRFNPSVNMVPTWDSPEKPTTPSGTPIVQWFSQQTNLTAVNQTAVDVVSCLNP